MRNDDSEGSAGVEFLTGTPSHSGELKGSPLDTSRSLRVADGLLDAKLLHILQHSLGLDQYGRGRQYRNHFATTPESSDGSRIAELVALGFYVGSRTPSDVGRDARLLGYLGAVIDDAFCDFKIPHKVSLAHLIEAARALKQEDAPA